MLEREDVQPTFEQAKMQLRIIDEFEKILSDRKLLDESVHGFTSAYLENDRNKSLTLTELEEKKVFTEEGNINFVNAAGIIFDDKRIGGTMIKYGMSEATVNELSLREKMIIDNALSEVENTVVILYNNAENEERDPHVSLAITDNIHKAAAAILEKTGIPRLASPQSDELSEECKSKLNEMKEKLLQIKPEIKNEIPFEEIVVPKMGILEWLKKQFIQLFSAVAKWVNNFFTPSENKSIPVVPAVEKQQPSSIKNKSILAIIFGVILKGPERRKNSKNDENAQPESRDEPQNIGSAIKEAIKEETAKEKEIKEEVIKEEVKTNHLNNP
jgi:hypothetical protein